MPFYPVLSPQFEICYALADLASPAPRISPEWTGIEGKEPEWLAEAKCFGWGFWLAVPDIFEAAPPAVSLEEMFVRLRQVGPEDARRSLVRGLFHSEAAGSPTAAKREWLAFIGIDGSREESATAAALRREGQALLNSILGVLERFRPIFEPVWDKLVPQLEESRRRTEEACAGATLGQVAERLRLPVEVDERARTVQALRGGYRLNFDERTSTYLIPSAFNRRRFWTVAEGGAPATIFFPYLDPALQIHGDRPSDRRRPNPDQVDPWLVCKALGDPTRAAILRRIAREPRTSAQLGGELRLSKATISHHIFQLREAGLIKETPRGRSIRLSLRTEMLEALSWALLCELDGEVPSGANPPLDTNRPFP